MHTISLKEVDGSGQALWKQIGWEAYKAEPDFLGDNIFWPDIETIEPDRQYLYLAAFMDGKAAGRCLLKSAEKMNSAILLDICVIPELRLKGVGSCLLKEAERKALEWGKDTLRVMSDIDDEKLHLLPFFIKGGFGFGDAHSILIKANFNKNGKIRTQCRTTEGNGFRLRRLNGDNKRDVEIATAMHRKYFPTFPGFMSIEETIQLLFRKQFIFLVSEKAGEVAGVVVGKENTTTHHYRHVRCPGTGLLTSIATNGKYRGQGIATSLIVALADEINKYGCTKLLYGGVAMGSPSMRLAIRTGGSRIINHITVAKSLSSTK
jgi:GNAT superfamily N-acetyltransferase